MSLCYYGDGVLVYLTAVMGNETTTSHLSLRGMQWKRNRTPAQQTLCRPGWVERNMTRWYGTDQRNNRAVVIVVLRLCVCKSNHIVYHSHSRLVTSFPAPAKINLSALKPTIQTWNQNSTMFYPAAELGSISTLATSTFEGCSRSKR